MDDINVRLPSQSVKMIVRQLDTLKNKKYDKLI